MRLAEPAAARPALTATNGPGADALDAEGPPLSLGPDVRRALRALWRARVRAMGPRLPRSTADALRLVAPLLHASFGRRRDAPPGVVGLRYRPSWSSLARAFGLDPPNRAQRGRALVQAVLAIPARPGPRVLVVLAHGLTDAELDRIDLRVALALQTFAKAGVALSLDALDLDRLGADREELHRFAAGGALLAGELPPALWRALERARRPIFPLTTAALAAEAGTPRAALALALLAGVRAPSPLDASIQLLARGQPARALADPERFAMAWAGLDARAGALLERFRSLCGDEPLRPGALPPGGLAELVALGRELAVACVRAVRASRLGRADPAAALAWREALGPGFPRALRPAVGLRLAGALAARTATLALAPAGRAFSVRWRDATGVELEVGHGATPAQARTRALALVAGALAARPGAPPIETGVELPDGVDATWREVARRIVRGGDRPRLFLALVAATSAETEPPLDPLNRGPSRVLELEASLAVHTRPGHQPSARVLDAESALALALRPEPGLALEVAPAGPAAWPIATRVASLAALVRDNRSGAPLALEAGGRIMLLEGARVRTFALDRFARRPRRYACDPAAPDLSVAGPERAARALPGTVRCRALLCGERAALLYTDELGFSLREEVRLSELELRIAEARAILRSAPEPAVLLVHAGEGLEAALRRAGTPGPRMPLDVLVASGRISASVGGERFGGGAALGWRDAVEALLARLPASLDGVLAVDRVDAVDEDAPAVVSPLLRVYAAVAVRRRLQPHLRRALATYRNVSARR